MWRGHPSPSIAHASSGAHERAQAYSSWCCGWRWPLNGGRASEYRCYDDDDSDNDDDEKSDESDDDDDGAVIVVVGVVVPQVALDGLLLLHMSLHHQQLGVVGSPALAAFIEGIPGYSFGEGAARRSFVRHFGTQAEADAYLRGRSYGFSEDVPQLFGLINVKSEAGGASGGPALRVLSSLRACSARCGQRSRRKIGGM